MSIRARGSPGPCDGFVCSRGTLVVPPSLALPHGPRWLPLHQPSWAMGSRRGKKRRVCPLPLTETSPEADTLLSLCNLVKKGGCMMESCSLGAVCHPGFWLPWLPRAGMQGKRGMSLMCQTRTVSKAEEESMAELRGSGEPSVCRQILPTRPIREARSGWG